MKIILTLLVSTILNIIAIPLFNKVGMKETKQDNSPGAIMSMLLFLIISLIFLSILVILVIPLDDTGLLLILGIFLAGRLSDCSYNKLCKLSQIYRIDENEKPCIYILDCVFLIALFIVVNSFKYVPIMISIIVGKYCWFDTTLLKIRNDLTLLIINFPVIHALIVINVFIGDLLAKDKWMIFYSVFGGLVLALCVVYWKDASGLIKAIWNALLKKGKMDIVEQSIKENAIVKYPVSLVGAGPGDAGLLTWRGLACIRTADVIVYDNLISGSLLNEARSAAELIYVGKRLGAHSMTQEQINQILIEQAQSGKYVVRLKGGDPFVFGRGGEEAAALRSHGLTFEVVPGVSSAYSVPAYAGIPVTDRRCASSFHVITGHESVGKKESVVDYQALAQAEGTLIFLMGLSRLEEIAQSLIRYGKCPETPTAVIERGSTARQREIVSDLAHIAEKSRVEGMNTPAVIVVGDVAVLSEKLSWYGRGLLGGKRVLVTGTRYFSQEMERVLHPLGAETVSVSVIENHPILSEEMEQAIRDLAQYTWVVFTSGNGVEIFFQQMRARRIDLRSVAHMKMAVIGRKTAAVLESHGFQCDFAPECCYTSEALAAEWIPTLNSDDRVLMLRARDSSQMLPERLAGAGIPYDDVTLYETWTDIRRREEINRMIKEVDYVTVASSSAVRALQSLLEEPLEKNVKVISIGPVTTKAAQAAGLSVYATADEYTAEGIVETILADIGR